MEQIWPSKQEIHGIKPRYKEVIYAIDKKTSFTKKVA